ncbi:hypothetical protein B9Z45_02455 [Limnohabitans sp. 2KL-17]|uniref:glycine zipper 2TM domain-containing protein n=1 Tax=Limnohabitans sp. 2KL-17 TaxID=1100704 RepID=UPI000D36A5D4|nr:glycine zipper 2TM domain-containing protein [Limnohabitans sp. 2KL-17]PUE62939.1 hypothetical protein B9Z45_02455 [Limnohabitans sp. 2KL-17]
MKKLTALVLLATAGLAQAQEVGQVISRTAFYQQVAMPRQTCSQAPVAVQNPTTGAGALMGAIAGGVIGNQIGGGSGRALATMAGVVGGAIMGEKVENPGSQVQNQTTCTTQTVYENRLTGYNVVYEYAGKQYNVQLPQDPGPTIQLQVTPLSAPRSEATAISSVTMSAAPVTLVTESRVVYVPSPAYRNHPPVYTNVNLGWGWGSAYGYSPRYGHWR